MKIEKEQQPMTEETANEKTNEKENDEFEFLFTAEENEKFSYRFGKSLKEYMWRGVMAFLVIIASFAVVISILRFDQIMDGVRFILGILEPIIYGLVIAYLINPIMKGIENKLSKIFEKHSHNHKYKKIIRGISLFLAMAFACIVIVVLLGMVLPDLIMSVTNLVRDLPSMFNVFMKWLEGTSINEQADEMIQETLLSVEEYLMNWIKTGLLGEVNKFVSTISNGVFGILAVLKNVFVGVIISVYVLANKESFSGQTKKVLYAVCPERTANIVMEIVRDSNRIFIGFLSGKIMDSMIIGIICFIVLSILNIPYTLIVSVIVGVTNIIPFFGPYIGAIPSALLILLTDPKAGLIFIVFIIILQQIDGNLIGPKILGDSTGLSAFWVIFAIMVGSGLFGFIGMILGVPTFAVIYHIITKAVNQKLKQKQLPTNTEQYSKLHAIKDKQFISNKEQSVGTRKREKKK